MVIKKQKTKNKRKMLIQAWNTLLLEFVNNLNGLVTTPELKALSDRIKVLKYGDPSLMNQFRQNVLPVSSQLASSDVACLGAMEVFEGCRLERIFLEAMSSDERKQAFETLQDLYNRAMLEKTCRAGIEDVQQLCADIIRTAEGEVDLKDPYQAMPALMRSLCSGPSMAKVSRIVDQITRTANPDDVCELLRSNGAGAIGESLAAEMKRAEVSPSEDESEGIKNFLSPDNMAKLMASAMGSRGAGAPVGLKDLFSQMGSLFPALSEQPSATPAAVVVEEEPSAAEQVD